MCHLQRTRLEFLIFLVLVEEESQTLVLFFVYFKKNFSWCLTTYASYKTKKYFFYMVYIQDIFQLTFHRTKKLSHFSLYIFG